MLGHLTKWTIFILPVFVKTVAGYFIRLLKCCNLKIQQSNSLKLLLLSGWMYCDCCLWINRKTPGIIEIFRFGKQLCLTFALLLKQAKPAELCYWWDEPCFLCVGTFRVFSQGFWPSILACLGVLQQNTLPLCFKHDTTRLYWVAPLYFCRKLHSSQRVFCIGLVPSRSWHILLKLALPHFEIKYISVFALICGQILF